MRIYTEVIFKWDDAQGKLVETSSKSYEYSGRLALCGAGDKYNAVIGYNFAGDEFWAHGVATVGGYDNVRLQKKPYNKESDTYGEKHDVGGTGAADDASGVITVAKNAFKAFFPSVTLHSTFDDARAEGGWAMKEDSFGVDEDSQAKEVTMDALKGLEDQWVNIMGGDSEYHRKVEDSLDTLTRAGEGVEGETYTDPVTGDVIPIQGAMEVARGDYATSVSRAKEDLGVAVKAAGVATKRAGTARETALRGARKELAPQLRAAEAAAAATGFAGTGAGDAARASLAEEFMEDVGDIETARTQVVEDIGTELAGARTIQQRAVEEADIARGVAAGDFAGAVEAHGQTVAAQTALAQSALLDIQGDMTDLITGTQTFLDDYTWSPFTDENSSFLGKQEDFGTYLDPGFDPAIANEFAFKPTPETDITGG